jgi:hypothetical protein
LSQANRANGTLLGSEPFDDFSDLFPSTHKSQITARDEVAAQNVRSLTTKKYVTPGVSGCGCVSNILGLSTVGLTYRVCHGEPKPVGQLLHRADRRLVERARE